MRLTVKNLLLRHPTGLRPTKFVTAADSSHFLSLLGLLESIKHYESGSQVAVWDLGLTIRERRAVEVLFPSADLHSFDFDSHPEFMRLSNEVGSYAWKPVIIFSESQNYDGLLIWLDAGNRLTRHLSALRTILANKGFYSPYSQGTVSDWTHPTMLSRLSVASRYHGRRNLNGAVVCFDTRHPRALGLLVRWCLCAEERNCIAPEGSSRSNHRQDQSALSCIAYSLGAVRREPIQYLSAALGIRIHCDDELDVARKLWDTFDSVN